jgi:hypothetical protein
MPRYILFISLLLASCNTIQKATYKLEEEHNALYKQKALIVYDVKYNKVLLTNPAHTRFYYLKGKHFTRKWQEGDTLIIDSNLQDFYNLKYAKKCDR